MIETLSLEEYRQRALRCDWRAVYQELYPEYWQDFSRCTEQDHDDGPDAWAFQE